MRTSNEELLQIRLGRNWEERYAVSDKTIKSYSDVTDVLRGLGLSNRNIGRLTKDERIEVISRLGYRYDPQAKFGNVQVTEAVQKYQVARDETGKIIGTLEGETGYTRPVGAPQSVSTGTVRFAQPVVQERTVTENLFNTMMSEQPEQTLVSKSTAEQISSGKIKFDEGYAVGGELFVGSAAGATYIAGQKQQIMQAKAKEEYERAYASQQRSQQLQGLFSSGTVAAPVPYRNINEGIMPNIDTSYLLYDTQGSRNILSGQGFNQQILKIKSKSGFSTAFAPIGQGSGLVGRAKGLAEGEYYAYAYGFDVVNKKVSKTIKPLSTKLFDTGFTGYTEGAKSNPVYMFLQGAEKEAITYATEKPATVAALYGVGFGFGAAGAASEAYGAKVLAGRGIGVGKKVIGYSFKYSPKVTGLALTGTYGAVKGAEMYMAPSAEAKGRVFGAAAVEFGTMYAGAASVPKITQLKVNWRLKALRGKEVTVASQRDIVAAVEGTGTEPMVQELKGFNFYSVREITPQGTKIRGIGGIHKGLPEPLPGDYMPPDALFFEGLAGRRVVSTKAAGMPGKSDIFPAEGGFVIRPFKEGFRAASINENLLSVPGGTFLKASKGATAEVKFTSDIDALKFGMRGYSVDSIPKGLKISEFMSAGRISGYRYTRALPAAQGKLEWKPILGKQQPIRELQYKPRAAQEDMWISVKSDKSYIFVGVRAGEAYSFKTAPMADYSWLRRRKEPALKRIRPLQANDFSKGIITPQQRKGTATTQVLRYWDAPMYDLRLDPNAPPAFRDSTMQQGMVSEKSISTKLSGNKFGGLSSGKTIVGGLSRFKRINKLTAANALASGQRVDMTKSRGAGEYLRGKMFVTNKATVKVVPISERPIISVTKPKPIELTRDKIAPITIQIFDSSQMPKIIPLPKLGEIKMPVPVPPEPKIIPIKEIPPDEPPPPIVSGSLWFPAIGGGRGRRFNKNIWAGREFKYVPDIKSWMLDIRKQGKAPAGKMTGLEARPIYVRGLPKKPKRRKYAKQRRARVRR